jgi:hypothetical protein
VTTVTHLLNNAARIFHELNLTGRNQPAISSHVNWNLNLLLTNALLPGSAAGGV